MVSEDTLIVEAPFDIHVVVYEPVYSVIYPPQSIHAGINMGRSTVPVIAVFTKVRSVQAKYRDEP